METIQNSRLLNVMAQLSVTALYHPAATDTHNCLKVCCSGAVAAMQIRQNCAIQAKASKSLADLPSLSLRQICCLAARLRRYPVILDVLICIKQSRVDRNPLQN